MKKHSTTFRTCDQTNTVKASKADLHKLHFHYFHTPFTPHPHTNTTQRRHFFHQTSAPSVVTPWQCPWSIVVTRRPAEWQRQRNRLLQVPLCPQRRRVWQKRPARSTIVFGRGRRHGRRDLRTKRASSPTASAGLRRIPNMPPQCCKYKSYSEKILAEQ